MGKKLGIALAGGGARGAYQIGVLKALKEQGLLKNLFAISGASVGSLNACLLAMGDLDKAEKLWLSLDKDALLTHENHMFRRLMKEKLNIVFDGMYSTKHLEKLIDETLDYELVRANNVFVATSYVGKEETNFFELMSINVRNFFGKETLIRYPNLSTLSNDAIKQTLLASCAIPVVFKPVKIDHKTYYDGGVLDNTPYQPLIDAGCDEIIVIDLFHFKLRRPKHIKEVTLHYFFPTKNLRGILDFRKEQIIRRLTLGYEDAHILIDKIKKIEA